MKDINQAESIEIMKRNCVVCGKMVNVTLYATRKYSGGHYFGDLNVGKIKAEYWECDECFKK